MKHIEPDQIIASRRFPSSHGRNIEYELLHCVANWEQDHSHPVEVVLIRMVYDGRPHHKMAPEILIQDLERFQIEWANFAAASITHWEQRNES